MCLHAKLRIPEKNVFETFARVLCGHSPGLAIGAWEASGSTGGRGTSQTFPLVAAATHLWPSAQVWPDSR